MWAASTPSEANSLPKLYHVLNHFHEINMICEFFKMCLWWNVWPPGQRAEIHERIASESLRKIPTKFYGVVEHVCRAGFLRCVRNPIRVPRIKNRVPRIREIGYLQVYTEYLTFSLKKTAKCIANEPFWNLTVLGKFVLVNLAFQAFWVVQACVKSRKGPEMLTLWLCRE